MGYWKINYRGAGRKRKSRIWHWFAERIVKTDDTGFWKGFYGNKSEIYEATAVATSKIFKRTNDVQKEKGMNTKVLEFITVQTDILMSEIADRLGALYKTVQRAVAELKMSGVIERIGGRKKGYWRIKEG